jgi:glycerol-3-phosphate acyltransferase PlsX
MRIGIDAMGGDGAPAEVVRGALAGKEWMASADDRIVLIGDESAIRAHLDGADGWQEFIEVVHAEDVIGMNAPPVEAVRARPDSSIVTMANLHRAGEVDAMISAGNTGACVAAAQMRLHRLRGVHRPGIAVVSPTTSGPVAICDVGANVNCRPQHLHQYGVMASVYMKAAYGVEAPRVGLLNIGEEEAKGNDLVRHTRALMREDESIEFVGNVEGRDLFTGACDVMVCEGFVGNVVLKLIEGMAESLIRSLASDIARMVQGSGGEAFRQAARKLMLKYDYNEYGGAPLLGVGGICIICHGASDYRGIKNAVRCAYRFAEQRVNEQITSLLAEGQK